MVEITRLATDPRTISQNCDTGHSDISEDFQLEDDIYEFLNQELDTYEQATQTNPLTANLSLSTNVQEVLLRVQLSVLDISRTNGRGLKMFY